MEISTPSRYEQLCELTSGDFQAFLYDCDGTLADNMKAHTSAYVEVARTQYDIDLDGTIIDELAGWPTVQVCEEIGRRYNKVFDPTQFASAKSQLFYDKYIQETKPVDFVLRHLINHVGRVKIGVVSGGRRTTVTRTLTILNIIDLVDVMVCAGETERGKPYPDPFLKAAEELGVDPTRCMVFEDGDAGVQSAIAAGMKWVRVDKL
ncbi:HAD family hydrolase [Dinghuibacter silviterrae]|uniref:HAD superfamily hydrolase (TIGR01509 family) n=1 Tax=Dinghuibacter silviterrae TaxID=1539049 RepID=A0A4R8DNJ1_9BACT|nr:HAD-IA family hydrolase [Dinghuibacter silviterrae]TDW99378.1 HAD superfamily hydrolase (TIGR01509 family) [Dinghuibacter silviterrae]